MTPTRIREIREACEKATPGPWEWFGNTKMTEVYLATVNRGRIFIMDFVRWGMASAQPRFQVRRKPNLGLMVKLQDLDGEDAPRMVASHRKEFVGIGHPDAAFIALARTALPEALAEIERLQRYVKHHDEEYLTMKEVLRAEHAACQRLRAALVEACDIAEAPLVGRTGDIVKAMRDRIAELRKELADV